MVETSTRIGRRASRRRRALRLLATGLVLLLAFLASALVWQEYVTAPWTRDGQVRVQVAAIAPQVSGQIVELRVVDNQRVAKGDVLYVIDPFDFQVALDSAKADVENRAADLQVKRAQASRREQLTTLSTSVEEKQQYAGTAKIAEAAYASAQAQAAQADENLKRTQVRSPVNGYVTNLLLRVGNWAAAGATNISVVDSDSYWVDGYFEETKMARVRLGAPVEAALMGYSAPIRGRVESITRGIATANAAASTQGLPSVDPVYTWVRLAQRVPVRVRIESVPDGVPLVAGMTATVTVEEGEGTNGGTEPRRIGARLRALVAGFAGRGGPAGTASGTAADTAADTTSVDGAGTVATIPAPPAPKNRAVPDLPVAERDPPRPR